jgi:hypothetical protein
VFAPPLKGQTNIDEIIAKNGGLGEVTSIDERNGSLERTGLPGIPGDRPHAGRDTGEARE